MRLQKFIAHAGVCSRRKAEEYILDGKIFVNNKVITTLGTKIDPKTDIVEFNGQKIEIQKNPHYIYIALNKPKGYITSCSQKNSKIILDLVKIHERIYPIGRLDKDSCGLILLSNDGDLHNKLSHPSFNHEKEYIVKTKHSISNKDLHIMSKGMIIDNIKTRKATVKRISDNSFKIVLKQGLNRQIRKMVAQTENQVIFLKRVRMGNVILSNLKEGFWRYLTKKEIIDLHQ